VKGVAALIEAEITVPASRLLRARRLLSLIAALN
jgi:hypothetical protein